MTKAVLTLHVNWLASNMAVILVKLLKWSRDRLTSDSQSLMMVLFIINKMVPFGIKAYKTKCELPIYTRGAAAGEQTSTEMMDM